MMSNYNLIRSILIKILVLITFLFSIVYGVFCQNIKSINGDFNDQNKSLNDTSKLFLYYGILGFQNVTQDTVFLEKDVYIFINRKNGSLNFKKGNQPIFPIPKEYHDDISNFIFDNFLADDPFGILDRMKEMDGLISNAKVGIDISQHQSPKPIDWIKVKKDTLNAPIDFVIIRSTLGYNCNYDSKFRKHYEGAIAQGFPIGLYHNFVMNKVHRPDFIEHAKEQANKFVESFNNRNIDFKPILDIELHPKYAVVDSQFTSQQIVNATKAFISIVEEKLETDIIIYTFESFYYKYLKGHFDDKYVWIARFPHTPNFVDKKYFPGSVNPFLGISYDFKAQKFNYNLKNMSIGWQFSENGIVDGIYVDSVDLNIILKNDYANWLWLKN